MVCALPWIMYEPEPLSHLKKKVYKLFLYKNYYIASDISRIMNPHSIYLRKIISPYF